jgi:hypothetical protein
MSAPFSSMGARRIRSMFFSYSSTPGWRNLRERVSGLNGVGRERQCLGRRFYEKMGFAEPSALTQYSRKRRRCQRRTVSGVTITSECFGALRTRAWRCRGGSLCRPRRAVGKGYRAHRGCTASPTRGDRHCPAPGAQAHRQDLRRVGGAALRRRDSCHPRRIERLAPVSVAMTPVPVKLGEYRHRTYVSDEGLRRP